MADTDYRLLCPGCTKGRLNYHSDRLEYWGCENCGDVFYVDKDNLTNVDPHLKYTPEPT